MLAVNTINPQLVVRDGFEPSTEAFSAPYSTRLSYLTIKSSQRTLWLGVEKSNDYRLVSIFPHIAEEEAYVLLLHLDRIVLYDETVIEEPVSQPEADDNPMDGEGE